MSFHGVQMLTDHIVWKPELLGNLLDGNMRGGQSGTDRQTVGMSQNPQNRRGVLELPHRYSLVIVIRHIKLSIYQDI